MKTSRLMPPTPPSSTSRLKENEFELLCALAGANLSPLRLERLAGWNLTAVDWKEFLRLAEHHGVLPLAARNLTGDLTAHPTNHPANHPANQDRSEPGEIETSRRLPPEVERSLRSSYEANLRRNLWFTAELVRIIRHFEQRQLPAIPYKGPALAQSLYGDVGRRSFSDLDFLISPPDFERAKRILSEIQYRPAADLAPPVERFWLKNGYERSFDGADGKNLVELQWALLPHFYAVDACRGELSMENLLQRAGRTTVGGCQVLCLSPEDSLLVLCLHAAKHLWTRLIWLVDIAETLRLPVDHALVASRARVLGIARILGVSFWLVNNVLHEELPQFAQEMIAVDPRVSALGREFAARVARATPYDFESTEYFRMIMRLRERPSHRYRYLWRLISTPGASDLATVRLPEMLFPLYRIVRVGRLLRKTLF